MTRPLPKDIGATLHSYRDLLKGEFGARLHALRLFGSRARGDADVDSDVDVAVVIDGLTDSERARAINLAFDAWRSTGRHGPVLAPLVWSTTELEELLAHGRRVALDIMNEGIAI